MLADDRFGLGPEAVEQLLHRRDVVDPSSHHAA
jgi:hypothetical protein